MGVKPGNELVRSWVSILRELRDVRLSGRRTAVSLTTGERVEGWVVKVAATGAFVVISQPEDEEMHVPVQALLAVHHPAIGHDSDYNVEAEKEPRWHGRAYAWEKPQEEALFDRDAWIG